MLPRGKFLVKPVFASINLGAAVSHAFVRMRSSISAGQQVDSAQDGRISFYASPKFHGGGATTDHYLFEHAQGAILGTSVDTFFNLEFLDPANNVLAVTYYVLILDLQEIA